MPFTTLGSGLLRPLLSAAAIQPHHPGSKPGGAIRILTNGLFDRRRVIAAPFYLSVHLPIHPYRVPSGDGASPPQETPFSD